MGALLHFLEDVVKVVSDGYGVWMIGAQRFFLDCQRPAKERFGFRILALRFAIPQDCSCRSAPV